MRVPVAIAICCGSVGPAASAPAPDQPVITYVNLVSPIAFEPSYKISIAPDGHGTVTGLGRFSAFFRSFVADAAAYRAFAAALQPFRPAGSRQVPSSDPDTARRECPALATDQDTIEVGWFGPAARRDRLSYYLGCSDAGGRRKAAGLTSAPDLLPIKPILAELAAALRKP